MHENLQITFRGMSSSPAIELLIRERTERLARFNPLIQRCHVVVEQPHRHHHKGRAYSVRVDVVTPADDAQFERFPRWLLYRPDNSGRPCPVCKRLFTACNRLYDD